MPLSNPRLAVILLLTVPIPVRAQSSQAPAVAMPRLISVSGTLRPADGQPPAAVETVTLAIYGEESGGTPLWQETQQVAVDAEGRYTLFLGATQPEGVPLEVFASGQAQWLGVVFNRPGEGDGARMRITSVPYALHAADAVTLGGRPASDFVLTPTKNGLATTSTVTTASADTVESALNVVQAGTLNALAKYVDADNVGPSAVSELGGRLGINTGAALPADYLHIKFNDQFGALTGLAVQNLSNSPSAASGMLFYDHNGALSQFQGFNNTTHAYGINNIASGGSINFLLGSVSKFLVAPNGNIGIGTVSPAHHLTVIGGPAWTANAWTGAVALDNASALGWYANGAGNRFGIGHGTGGLYFFHTASDPGTAGSVATYDMVINDAGNVGIGVTSPDAKLQVAAGNTTGILVTSQGNAMVGYGNGPSFAAIYGQNDSTGGFGMYGKGNANVGVRGDGYQGVYGSGTFGVFGTSSNGYGVYGECTGTCYSGFFAGEVKVLANLSVDVNGLFGGDVYAQTFNETSDRAVKANFANVNSRDILQRLASIPIQTYNFKSDAESVRHLGPMAQDFRAAFNLGIDDKHIATVDADGVALAAIQGLYQLVQENEKQLEQQREAIGTLRRLQEDLVALKTLVCAEHHAAAVCR